MNEFPPKPATKAYEEPRTLVYAPIVPTESLDIGDTREPNFFGCLRLS